jgi:hypothetical protein
VRASWATPCGTLFGIGDQPAQIVIAFSEDEAMLILTTAENEEKKLA